MPRVRHVTLDVEKEVSEDQLPNLGPLWEPVDDDEPEKDQPKGKKKGGGT